MLKQCNMIIPIRTAYYIRKNCESGPNKYDSNPSGSNLFFMDLYLEKKEKQWIPQEKKASSFMIKLLVLQHI